jgi:hypothetical protein
MNTPGFNADACLSNIARIYSIEVVSPDFGHSGKVVPQQTWLDCFSACQNSWSTCLSQCQWWEWMIGSCVLKCRVPWFDCVGRC